MSLRFDTPFPLSERSALESVREAGSDRWRFLCPECGSKAFSAGSDLLCPAEGRRFTGTDGVLPLLRSASAEALRPFLDSYREVRRAEGWGGPVDYYRGLPFASEGRHRGVWKAPANEVIELATGLERAISRVEQSRLNNLHANCLRHISERGVRVMGARTLSSDSDWKYVPVRRLLLFLESSIDRGLQWVVFEPNDEPTWARVRQAVTNFLITVWRSGALQGATADEAFFVRCDFTTMTQDDIDNGRLICEIGIAPVKPAEFVIFRIQQKTLAMRVA